MRIGSLCSGYGGLELATDLVLGPLDHAWHGEYDPAPAAVLARHWPNVRNLGDIAAVTAADGWADLDPVDIVAAGYPCQPFSAAGIRKGFDDPRNRWPDVHAAIRALRPRLVILENVRGHLNRGFPTVVASLAALGYVGRWRCVRASDAGAAHHRDRLFAVAWPQEATPPHLAGDGADPARHADRLTLLPSPPTARAGNNRGGAGGRVGPIRPSLDQVDRLLPTPTATHWGRNATAHRRAPKLTTNVDGWTLADVAHADRWGAYTAAIRRWEHVLGRPAPEPTITTRGRRHLSPVFVEWLMGLPLGHVTDVITKRADALRILGNGVVPQAAARALRLLLGESTARPVQFDLFDAMEGTAA
ncbi:DNA cytosine methyltransferase [Actinoplanes utahensis]|uniref:DNA cytosine methyltransferase n=1 Tax=Actinoplanes utahensis TaxID=1869 RepID=UPI001F0047A2|nr:DNA cytosine methyltransferase [Actinoplanes utahensis]